MWGTVLFVLSQITRLTDVQTALLCLDHVACNVLLSDVHTPHRRDTRKWSDDY